jgi:hypothetical protein
MLGPYELAFDPDLELIRFAKQMLAASKNSWGSFRDYDGKTLFYLTRALANRPAIEELHYGIDSEPNKVFHVPPADPNNPFAMDAELAVASMIEVPSSTKFATIQLKFKDGTASEIQRYTR